MLDDIRLKPDAAYVVPGRFPLVPEPRTIDFRMFRAAPEAFPALPRVFPALPEACTMLIVPCT
jgi:hypothetical protein